MGLELQQIAVRCQQQRVGLQQQLCTTAATTTTVTTVTVTTTAGT